MLLAAAVTSLAASGLRANEKVYVPQAIHGTVLILTADGSIGTGVLVDADRRIVVTANHVPGTNDTVTVIFADFDERGRVIAGQRCTLLPGRPAAGRSRPRSIHRTSAKGRPGRCFQPGGAAHGSGRRCRWPQTARRRRRSAVHMIGNASLLRNALFGTRSGKVDSVYRNEPTEKFPLVAKVVATSIATNKGDSGGPVLNDKGELVGIVSMGSICWGTAKKSGPIEKEKIAEHPLARQQAVNLSIDVTEVRALLKQAGDARPVVARKREQGAPSVKAARSLVGGKWAFTRVADNDVLTSEVVFRADGTFRRTVSTVAWTASLRPPSGAAARFMVVRTASLTVTATGRRGRGGAAHKVER